VCEREKNSRMWHDERKSHLSNEEKYTSSTSKIIHHEMKLEFTNSKQLELWDFWGACEWGGMELIANKWNHFIEDET
jgi:hypothetical protein